MSSQFQFFGFQPDEALENNAHRSLDHLIDLSPSGTLPVALLEKTREGFRCAIDLYTRNGPFIAHSFQSTPDAALTQACTALYKKIENWRKVEADYRDGVRETAADQDRHRIASGPWMRGSALRGRR